MPTTANFADEPDLFTAFTPGDGGPTAPSGAAPATDYSRNWSVGNVWNNGGDTATLTDAGGTTVDTFGY
ncbi:hypothetical protein [Halosegnis marinus]|uniref:Uncharacterized protein n=1 Tax=Halosegnis marinus TaxID=3034023 RepID=A0ABD5ZPT9_9EURY|nr:hypothetical protein [Halosegnis sp. DT85]